MKAIIMFMLLTASVNGRGIETETKTPMAQLVEAVKNSDYTFKIKAGEYVWYRYEYWDYFECGVIDHCVYYKNPEHSSFLSMYHYVRED